MIMALVSISFPKGQNSIKKSGEQALNHFFFPLPEVGLVKKIRNADCEYYSS